MEESTAVLDPQTEIELPPLDTPPGRGNLAGQLLADAVKTVGITAVVFILLTNYVVQGFRVYGKCMEPNLRTGERLFGNKLIYNFKAPQRGDVVIFNYPLDPQRIYIKRVVGLPGESVAINSGRVYINGKPLSEPYLKHVPHGDFGPKKIGSKDVFVMGDFRDYSNDSRYWGSLPRKNIVAKAWLKYWPLGRTSVVR
jgi:signal peptidase I